MGKKLLKIILFMLFVLIISIFFVYGYIQKEQNSELALIIVEKDRELDECQILFADYLDSTTIEIEKLRTKIDSLTASIETPQ